MAQDRLRDEPSELPRLALALTSLALAGFSLVLLCQTAWLAAAPRNEFAERNTLGERGRLILLLSLAAGLALPVLAGLLVRWRKGERPGQDWLERVAAWCAPVGVLFVVPGLFLSQLAQDKPLFYLVVLAAFGIVLQRLLVIALTQRPLDPPGSLRQRLRNARARLPRWHMPASVGGVLVCVAGLAYTLILGRYAVTHHRLIQTVTADLGVAQNVLANLLHHHAFRAPAQFGTLPGSFLGLHNEYGIFLFVPVFALRPRAETLLWLQAGLAAASVVPLFLIALKRLGHALALWLSAVYLLLAPLHGSLLLGFTWLPAVTLFTLTVYCFIVYDRDWGLWLAVPALLLVSDAGPLNALGLGLALVLVRQRVRLGVLLIALALPLIGFNLWLSLRANAAFAEPSVSSALVALWKNPLYFAWDLVRAAKIAAFLHALAPLCLLPVLEFACWPLLIPGVLFTSGSSTFWPNAGAGFTSAAVWVPGCMIALVFVLEKRRASNAGRAAFVATLVALSITVLSHSYDFGALLREDGFGGVQPSTVRMTAWGQARYDALVRVTSRIPSAASVAATTYLVPHVASRPDVYDLTRPYGSPDFILLSSRESPFVRDALRASFAQHRYRLVAAGFDEFYLFSKGNETPDTRVALERLGLETP